MSEESGKHEKLDACDLGTIDGVGFLGCESCRVPDRFLFPEILGAGCGVAGVVSDLVGGGDVVQGSLLMDSTRMVRWASVGLGAVMQGFWENGLFSLLLHGLSAGRWSRIFQDCAGLRFNLSAAPSFRSLAVPRTIPLLFPLSAGVRIKFGLPESNESFDLVTTGPGDAAEEALPLQVVLSLPPLSPGLIAGAVEVDGPAPEEGLSLEGPFQPPRRRGRPRKDPSCKRTRARHSASEEVRGEHEVGLSSSPVSLSISDHASGGRYFTRSKKTWLVGKVLGLEFEGNDIDAIRGLEKMYEDHFET